MGHLLHVVHLHCLALEPGPPHDVVNVEECAGQGLEDDEKSYVGLGQ